MSILIEKLQQRFGENQVRIIYFKAGIESPLSSYPFILIEVEKRSKIRILMTNGLSSYSMPVSEKFKGKENVELYFCLPSYWELGDENDSNMNWVFQQLFRLQHYVTESQSWFGSGHTVPFSSSYESVSEKMRQKYFLLNDPVFLKNELFPLEIEGKTVHFLGIVPIFEDEFDYKMGKGTYKLQKKLNLQGVSELLDDFRASVLKSKWRFLGK